jgi:uncharacterized DUF497 family protein
MRTYASTASRLNWPPPFSSIRNLLTVADLEHSATEDRWFSVGIAGNGVLLSVVYLWSDSDPAAIKVRLISARRSTQSECGQYQEAL